MITEERKSEFLKNKPYISLALNGHCSHGCWYCCDFASIGSKKGIIDYIGEELYISRILDLSEGTKADYRINGGEPFENKHILPVSSSVLNEGHDITFLSNLTCINNIFKTLKPFKKQIRFEASFHLGHYLNEGSGEKVVKYLSDYFPKAAEMSRAIEVIIVLTDNVLYSLNLDYYLKKIKLIGVANDCKVTFCMQELYASLAIGAGAFTIIRNYPRDYSDKDKDRIVELKREYENPDFKREDIDALCKANRVLYLKGKDCFYMNRMIDVHMDGKVSRCYSGRPYHKEDLVFTDMKLTDEYSPCKYDSCHCVVRGETACLIPNGLTIKDV